MTDKKAIAVFASGRGSNFQALCEAKKRGALSADLRVLVCNNANAKVLDVARSFDVPTLVVPNRGLKREEHEAELLEKLREFNVHWIVLAGYMRIFSKNFLNQFWDEGLNAYRVVNIHPSLLPEFPGMNAYEQAISAKAKSTGVTVHLVDDGVDTGPIVAQSPLSIDATDTAESLSAKGLALEHRFYSESLEKLLCNSWKVRNHRVVFEGEQA